LSERSVSPYSGAGRSVRLYLLCLESHDSWLNRNENEKSSSPHLHGEGATWATSHDSPRLGAGISNLISEPTSRLTALVPLYCGVEQFIACRRYARLRAENPTHIVTPKVGQHQGFRPLTPVRQAR